MYDFVHVDEKRFYMTEMTRSYYLGRGKISSPQCKEQGAYYCCCSTDPLMTSLRKTMSDGKIGIWLLCCKTQLNKAARTDLVEAWKHCLSILAAKFMQDI